MLIITPALIISCLIILALIYLFLNAIDNRKKILNVFIALVLTPIVYFQLWYPITNIFIPYHHHKSFNKEAWTEQPGLRYEMIDNMIETDYLIGKSQNQVSNLLGEVQWLSWDYSKNQFNSNAWNYGLGLLPGAFKTTKEDIEIIFKNDKVVKIILSQSPYSFEPESTETNKTLDSINRRIN